MTNGHVLELLDNHYDPDPRVLMKRRILAESGVEVDVLAWDKRESPGDLLSEDEFGFIRRFRVPSRAGEGAAKIPKIARFSLKVLIYIASNRKVRRQVGVLVANDIYLLPLGVLLSLILRRPLIYDAHEEFSAMEGERYPRRFLQAVETVESALAKMARRVLVPGESRLPRWTRVGIAPIVLRNLGSGIGTSSATDEAGQDATDWDVIYCGTLNEQRRLDLLVGLAESSPDIRIAVAGSGRIAPDLEMAASRLSNFDFLGWQADPDGLLRRSRAVYYGLDPTHPYSEKACPNNLYQALRAGKPLLFFCGGEPAEVLHHFDIGFRCSPDIDSLLRGIASLESTRFEVREAYDSLQRQAREGTLSFRGAIHELLSA